MNLFTADNVHFDVKKDAEFAPAIRINKYDPENRQKSTTRTNSKNAKNLPLTQPLTPY